MNGITAEGNEEERIQCIPLTSLILALGNPRFEGGQEGQPGVEHRQEGQREAEH